MLWINNVVFHSPGFETHKELVALLHINVNTVLQIKLFLDKNMSQKIRRKSFAFMNSYFVSSNLIHILDSKQTLLLLD
jgi:hypothetical protein